MLDQAPSGNTPIHIAVDDCWNHIGVKGDSTCPELQEHLRCLNCPTYAQAAIDMLDREAGESDFISGWTAVHQDALHKEETQSALIFRVGAEWLALPPQAITEVAPQNTIHSLPHQTNRAILGLTNIRGALVLCVSLAQMLNAQNDKRANHSPRLLVISHLGQKLVFPVDEVFGIYRYRKTELAAAPTTLAHSGTTYTQALIAWKEHKVGLLDCDLLCYALNRSLT